MLGQRLEKGSTRDDKKINVWLVNTGWSGGEYGKGSRIDLVYTRSMIQAALNGSLEETEFVNEPFFNLSIPTACPDVPNGMLNPRDTWPNENEYDVKAKHLQDLFAKNFEKYESFSNA